MGLRIITTGRVVRDRNSAPGVAACSATPADLNRSGEDRLVRSRLQESIAPVAFLVLVLAACAPEGPSGGGTAFDGIYVGTAWVTEGPRFCGDRSGESVEMVVSRGQARVVLTSNAIQGPVGSDGDLGALRWSGRDPVERPSASSGRITGESFTLQYTHDNCIYRLDGRRR
jgi:hypothetical protein